MVYIKLHLSLVPYGLSDVETEVLILDDPLKAHTHTLTLGARIVCRF